MSDREGIEEATVVEPRPDRLDAAELAAWRGLLRVHAALLKELDAELEQRHGLPVAHYEVLLHLADAEGERMRMGDLADAALLSRSGLTRLVDRMAAAGLLKRESCPSDARGSYAVLTEAGRFRLAEARPTHLAGVRDRFLRHFGRDELEQLGSYWDRVLPGASA